MSYNYCIYNMYFYFKCIFKRQRYLIIFIQNKTKQKIDAKKQESSL